MNIKDLEFFLQISREGSLRKASKSLYISPQGLGKAISNLEKDLGVKLFDRSATGIYLTEYGKLIMADAEQIVKSSENLKKTVNALKTETKEVVNLACSRGIIPSLSHDCFDGFRKINKNITLNIIKDTDFAVQSYVENYNDIGLAVGPVDNVRLDSVFLKRHNLFWVIPRKNPLSQNKRLRIVDLRNERFVLFSNEYAGYHRFITDCNEAGFQPDIIHFASEAITVYKLCKKYNAVACAIDFYTRNIEDEDFVFLPITEKRSSWEVFIITKAGSTISTAGQLFIEYLKNFVTQ